MCKSFNMAPVEDMTLLDFDRSNKGASKQRRDQINAEIATMRDLLPLPESSRQRLSQLQIMSLTCVYVRKCNILQKLFRHKATEKLPDSTDFFQALSGFVLVTTREGKLLYISENVTDYLGHSMVDMKTQGDSLYDIVDKRDHSTVQAQLLHGAPAHPRHGTHGNARAGLDKVDPAQDVSFFCRMNMSRTLKRQSGFGDVKVMHVRGHFITVRNNESDGGAETSCVFMATCSPLITPDLKETLVQSNTMVFKTVHKLDMSFIEVTKNAEHHLGCSGEDLAGKSWYTVLHPEDIHQAKDKHMQIIHSNHEMGGMITLRMLRADGSSFWVNSVMQVRQSNQPHNDEAFIVCTNQVIDENEAYQIKLQAHMFSMYPSRAHELWGGHLSAMATGTSTHDHLQTGHVAQNQHWVQQDGMTAVPMPVYHGNMSSSSSVGSMPNYQAQVAQGPHRMLQYQQTFGQQPAMMIGRQRQASVNQYSHAQPLVHSDQLKAMLKRKIKGPQQQQPDCKPIKVPKLENLEGEEVWKTKKQGINGYSERVMSSMIPSQAHHYNLPSSFQFVPQSSQNVQVMHVMQPEMYTFRPESAVGLKLTGSMPAFTDKNSTMTLMGSEQVVPDVNVPESFLTPEPSPISSPQPSTSTTVKVEDQATYVKKGSFNIIQALEKLAAMPHQMQQSKTPDADAKISSSTNSKQTSQGITAQRKRELPIFDAFDIDNFFDALDPPAGNSKESLKMEVQVKKEVETEALLKLQTNMDGVTDQINIKCEALSPPWSVSSMSPVHKAACQTSPTHGYNQQQQHIQPKNEFSTNSSCGKMSTHYGSAVPKFTAAIGMNTVANGRLETTNQMSPMPMSSCSPASVHHKQESLDDFLSYLSDEVGDDSPLHIPDLSQMTRESSTSSADDLLDEDHFQENQQQHQSPFNQGMALSYHSPTQDDLDELSPYCLEEQQQLPKASSLPHFAGELSPSSSSSSLVGEDEVIEGRTAFTFDIALKMLDMQGEDMELLQKDSLQIKDRDVMNLPDELGFILDSLVSSENPLEMIKHGQ